VARGQKRARTSEAKKSATLPRLPPASPDDRKDSVGLPVELPMDLPVVLDHEELDEKRMEPSFPNDAVPAPKVGDWVVASDGLMPWFGVITAMLKDDQIRVHHFKFRETKRGPPGKSFPVWINDLGRTRAQQFCPKKFDPAVYLINGSNVILTQSRGEKDFHLPTECLKALADYARTH
jgi:hypothetical protein